MKKITKKGKVFVGMSGGVDSSVTALLLKKQGYDVTGIFMRCYNIDGCAEQDAEDARRVAGHIGIPFYVWDFEEEYKKQVVDYMIREYKAGLTPNPDVMCNREIKFGLFFKRAMAMGADYVATGHYVRKVTSDRRQATRRNGKSMSRVTSNMSLYIARDTNKDQSYFLWTLTPEQIKHSLFPIGDYLKPKVRAIAEKAKLPTANKKDSQGICFLGKFDVSDFLKQYISEKQGDIVNTEGEKVGTHDGAYFYTIGQRHLGQGVRLEVIGDRKGKSNVKPYYVSQKNVKTNTITVAEGSDDPELYKKSVVLSDVNFTTGSPNTLKNIGMSVMARVRYRQSLSPAVLYHPKPKTYNLIFEEPQKFVAPGQSAVFYDAKGQMIGGGVIDFAK